MICVGASREVQAILSVYLSTLLSGYGTGFSAVAVPGIQEEKRCDSWSETRFNTFFSDNIKYYEM